MKEVPTAIHYSSRSGQKAVTSSGSYQHHHQHHDNDNNDHSPQGRQHQKPTTLSSYPLPEQALAHSYPTSSRRGGGGNNPKHGIAVYKVNKNGKLQARRLSFTMDRRALLVTTSSSSSSSAAPTSKFKASWGRLFRRSAGSKLSLSSSSGGNDTASLASTVMDHNGNSNGSSSSTKNQAKVICLQHVDRVQFGFHTAKWHRVVATLQEQIQATLQAGGGVLSIIYEVYDCGGCVPRLESLDCLVPNAAEYQLLASALTTLTQQLVPNQVRQAVVEVQYLRYHWSLLSTATMSGGGNSPKNNLRNHGNSVVPYKPLETPLSQQEWLTVAENMGLRLPKSKLQQIFAHQVAKQQKSHYHSGAAANTVDWTKIAYLVQKAYRMQGTEADDPISNIWKDLVENDPVPIITLDDSASFDSYELNVQNAEESISPVAFLGFLREQQGEVDWQLEQVTDLIHSLNTHTLATDNSFEMLQDKALPSPTSTSSSDPNSPLYGQNLDETFAGGDRLCYERFRHYLLSAGNDLLRAAAAAAPQDMSRPLSHYYICASHDTFLAALPADSWETANTGKGGVAQPLQPPPSSHGSPRRRHHHFHNKENDTPRHAPPTTVEAQNYLQVLIRGVRCLEMTIWDSPNGGKFPVLDRTDAALGPPLTTVWQAIRYFILEYDSQCFPILVRMENHCSTAVQAVLAADIGAILGDLVFCPRQALDASTFELPSPLEARGKVIFMAKRPRSMSETTSMKAHYVMHDDYDDENDVWDYVRTPGEVKSFDELSQRKEGLVVSFDTEGPIYAKSKSAMTRSPSELVEQADLALSQAQRDASEAKMRSIQYIKALENAKQEVENMAMRAGKTYDHIAKEVAKISTGGSVHQEEKSPKEEGIEIHEVLLSSATGQDVINRAKRNVAEAAAEVHRRQASVRDATHQWKLAQQKSEKILSHEDAIFAEARKARSEAAFQMEHSRAAAERFRKVQSLVAKNNETSSSAETVVVTAMTEAKISEKRATEAEARASRASATATKDRSRAETETNKEEELEQEVNEAAERCARAAEILQSARGDIEKISAQKKRLQDQVRLIELSSQYKLETSEGTSPQTNARHGGSFIEKHAVKLRELQQVESMEDQSYERLSQLEAEQRRLQKDFEEYNHLWKIQADIAAKVRKVADRSAHIAEELAEHAEEEREAANLRLTAHQRAEASVAKKDSHKESLDTQLDQARKAMEEANRTALESRKKADRLDDNAAKLTEGLHLRRDLKNKEQRMHDAKLALDEAVAEKQRCEESLRHEQRRIQITGEVAKAAKHDADNRGIKMQATSAYHEKAVKMYSEMLLLKTESEQAVKQSKRAQANVDTKAQIARRAREYKVTMDRVTEIPSSLASLTLLHTQKHAHWEKSIRMSSANVHCIAHHVLQRMVETQPDNQVKYIQQFTENHLCRIFPSWSDLQSRSSFNYDPVFPWKLGCQIVPMNYHSSDENLLVSEGFFRQNGSSGYVLKSPLLLGSRGVEQTERWRITILAGYNLPHPKRSPGRLHSLKPVVKISVHVGDVGSAPYAYETDYGKGTGPNPMYLDETCQVVVTEPSTAMVAFTVWDKQDGQGRQFIAGASIPVSRFQQGYRSILLFDSNHARPGPFAYASLFVHAEKER